MNVNDFSKGSVWKNIYRQAIPLILAQLVQLCYNVVDRIYIGHMPGADSMALTGLGLVFPLTALIGAFTNLFGTGGTPLFAMARGEQNDKKAEKILGNTAFLLIATSAVITVLCYIFKKPVMYLFGAGDESYYYANEYLKIYLLGTPFLMLTTGLNGFINAQGFPKIGMLTTVFGAALNLVLDPLFIFVFRMGVSGAAIATVISQIASAVWVIKFLTGKKAILLMKKQNLKADLPLTKKIVSLGFAGFIMQGTNCLVQVACNSTLKIYGGDLYVGAMTVVYSVRDILTLPISGLTSGAQPVLSYNFGAKEYGRVMSAIKISTLTASLFAVCAWALILMKPEFLMSVFTSDQNLIEVGADALHIYFFGFCFMAFQSAGQTAFTGLGYSKQAIFFSLLRKAIIVTPLTLLLPRLGFGADGVFMAEPVSNVIGGIACFGTMYFTVYRKLGKR